MSSIRRCLYEILGVSQDATDADIKKAYRTQALVNHPDKNPGKEEEASERFKEVQHAFSVLSDPHERAWYDSHRTQILRGQDPANKEAASADPANATDVDLFACFSSAAFKGFHDGPDGYYGFYADVFDRLWEEEDQVMSKEQNKHSVPSAAPFGGAGAEWETVRDFYRFWESFSSCKSFSFADMWNLADAPNRDYRRHMEKENKRERAKVKKEFNSTVRELVAFVKKRDPRVAARKAHEEREREQKQKEATAKEKLRLQQRKENAAQTRAARDEAIEEDAEGLDEILASIALDEEIERKQKKKKAGKRRADFIGSDDSINDNEPGKGVVLEETAGAGNSDEPTKPTMHEASQQNEDGDEDSDEDVEEELYCIACRKAFRTSAQQADHERSKKHRAAAAKLKKKLLEEEEIFANIQRKKLDAPDEPSLQREELSTESDLSDPGPFENGTNTAALDRTSKSKKKRKKKRSPHALNSTENDMAGDSDPEDRENASEDPTKIADSADETHSKTTVDADPGISTSSPQDKPEVTSEEPQLTKKQKRRLREQKKKDQAGESSPQDSLKCNVCNASFPSRNKLMRHVENTGHALHVPKQTTRTKRR